MQQLHVLQTKVICMIAFFVAVAFAQ